MDANLSLNKVRGSRSSGLAIEQNTSLNAVLIRTDCVCTVYSEEEMYISLLPALFCFLLLVSVKGFSILNFLRLKY